MRLMAANLRAILGALMFYVWLVSIPGTDDWDHVFIFLGVNFVLAAPSIVVLCLGSPDSLRARSRATPPRPWRSSWSCRWSLGSS